MSHPFRSNYYTLVFLTYWICYLTLSDNGLLLNEVAVAEHLDFPVEYQDLAASLEINKLISNATPPTGETFTYTIQYRCASTTDDCEGVVITDPLPSEIEFVSLVGSPHTINEVYDSGSRTVTFTFQNTLTAGSIGEVQIVARFPNGVTPNNTTALNTATISATNAPSESASVSATAYASAKIDFEKYRSAGGAGGGVMTYGFRVCNIGVSPPVMDSTLNLESIYIIDTLPTGSILLEEDLNGGAIINYDPVENIIQFSVIDLTPGQCVYPRLSLSLPDPPYASGVNVTNIGYLSTTPVGESEQTLSSTLTSNLRTPRPALYGPDKIASHTSRIQGEYGSYQLDFEINGTEMLNDFCMVDTIPSGMEITEISHGAYYYGGVRGGDNIVTIAYTTNLNGPTVITGSPFSRYLGSSQTIDVENDLGLTIGGPEYITSIAWCYGNSPAGFGLYDNVRLFYQIRLDASPGTVTNCVEFTTTTPGATLEEDCKDLTIVQNTNGAIASPRKIDYNNTAADYYNPGDTITFQIRAMNDAAAGAPLVDPELLDLLPADLSYVPGSWSIPGWSSTFSTSPIFSVVDNFNGSGRTLLTWSWSGASSTQVQPNEETNIIFQAVIDEEAPAGYQVIENRVYQLGGGVTDCYQSQGTDNFDLNGNGNTTELLCYGPAFININGTVSLESEKLVKGQLDTIYSKYPDVATSVPGGVADYILEIRNRGNLAVDSITIIDILPQTGDIGVIDTSPRNSRWRPNLVGTVSTPPGVTVFYSTESNPCRAAEGFIASGPSGCATPNWSTTPPTDLTTVQSLKFEFGSTVLNPEDTLQLSWPMRAPVNVFSTIGAPPDSVAWNSFGYLGRRTDNLQYTLPAEPLKVGIAVDDLVTNVYGDYAWEDSDQDGIQDISEVGINGVRVELFKDNGDGLTNPAVDTFVNFTLTANGGFYLFPGLPDGDYYAVFYKPSSMLFSPADQGGDDALDSDGTVGTWNGFDVAYTAITNLSALEYDLDWDLGLYPSTNGAVGDYVWHDVNNNGVQDEAPSDGINGVVVEIYQISSPTTPYATEVTSNDVNGNPGFYLFDELPPDNYFILFVLPSSTTFTTSGSLGSSDPNDSDANSTFGNTEIITVLAASYDNSWDAGLILSGVEDCSNGIDDDGDGLIDSEDPDCCSASAPTLAK
ncbi:MAG: SdrD B-like domain-containing protein [Bacteroidota bacterium]